MRLPDLYTLRLIEIERRWDKLLPERWELVVKGNTVKSLAIPGVCSGMSANKPNAEFIVNSKDDIKFLLNLIKAYVGDWENSCPYCGVPRSDEDN